MTREQKPIGKLLVLEIRYIFVTFTLRVPVLFLGCSACEATKLVISLVNRSKGCTFYKTKVK